MRELDFVKTTTEYVSNKLSYSNGIDGKKCLLLAICESAKFPLLESNGVLGHVLHIILT